MSRSAELLRGAALQNIQNDARPAGLAPSLVREITPDAKWRRSSSPCARQVERRPPPSGSRSRFVVFGGLRCVSRDSDSYGSWRNGVRAHAKLRCGCLGRERTGSAGPRAVEGYGPTAGGLGLGLIAALQVTRVGTSV